MARQFCNYDHDQVTRRSQAQRRFRERQKSLIGDLRESVSTLTRETEAQSKQIYVLQARPSADRSPSDCIQAVFALRQQVALDELECCPEHLEHRAS